MRFMAILFDLDGTLIDSAPDLRTTVNKLLTREGRRDISLEETARFIGNGAQVLIERAFRATGEAVRREDLHALTRDFLSFYEGHETDETTPYPTALETLDTLRRKGYRLALVTNKPQGPTENILKEFAMTPFFDVVIGGDSVDRKKPDPQMLKQAMKEMGLKEEDCLMVGDSPNDIGAAINAQMASIAVSYGYRKVPVEELGADHIIHRMEELLKYV